VQQAGRTGLYQDDVDGVSGGIMQFPGDPGALLGGREAAFTGGLAFGAQRPLFQLGHPLAPQPGPVADEPRTDEDQGPEC